MERELEERRVEIPAGLTRRPSEVVRDHVGFVVEPDAAPPGLLAECGQVLLYGSGERRLGPDAFAALPQSAVRDNPARLLGLSAVNA
jgi:hypothetical protein